MGFASYQDLQNVSSSFKSMFRYVYVSSESMEIVSILRVSTIILPHEGFYVACACEGLNTPDS